MDERRNRVRGRCLVGARVIFNNRKASLGCVVKNQTEEGCMLTFGETPFIPNEVELLFDNRKDFLRVRVCWRDDKRVGVAFVKDADTAGAPARSGMLGVPPQSVLEPMHP